MEELLNNPTVVFLIIILLVIIALSLSLLVYSWTRLKRVNRDNKYKNIYYDYIDKYSEDMCLLLNSDNLYPYYVSENIIDKLNISYRDICDDLTVFKEYVSKETYRKFMNEIKCWDRENDLRFEINYLINNKVNYGRIIIKFTDDKKYFLITLHDITIERNNNLEMQKELENTIAQSNTKTEFLSKMSHEIRTPMNGIIGMLDFATKENNDANIDKYLSQANELSGYLLSLINDILDMSRLENNKVELASDPYDLRDFRQRIDSLFKNPIESKGIKYVSEIIDVDEFVVIGDSMRLSQVIINFLSNAQKFTPSGGEITFTIKQLNKTSDNLSLMFRVRDTGKGISPDFINRIFHPFEQENANIASKYGGSGLGMAIADNMVNLMGGQIVVDSELGKGSDFTVFVDMPYTDKIVEVQKKKVVHHEVELKGLRVLFAEDNDINAMISVRMLEKYGINVTRAIDGQDVINKFNQSDINEYDVILMDINMPVRDGWQAAKMIRELGREDAKTVPIIAASADYYEEDKRKSKESGMNGHIGKPINLEEVKGILSTL